MIISPTHGRRQLEQAAYGAGKPGLALNDLAAVRIPLPPLDEQVEICNRVKTTFAALGDTFETIRHASRTGTACRSAILTAAFRGELIAQDPRDESASVLLERLRSAKALDVEEDNQRPADGKAKPAIASRRRIRKSSETVEGSAA